MAAGYAVGIHLPDIMPLTRRSGLPQGPRVISSLV
jgi:hypothetical protein